jgi:hypothetical protein
MLVGGEAVKLQQTIATFFKSPTVAIHQNVSDEDMDEDDKVELESDEMEPEDDEARKEGWGDAVKCETLHMIVMYKISHKSFAKMSPLSRRGLVSGKVKDPGLPSLWSAVVNLRQRRAS